jgi:fibronectin type 3 domain-containing protein
LIVEVDEPLSPPENVRVDYESDGVELRWDAPIRPAGIRVYRVYRGESERPDDVKPIGGTRRAETYFVDKTAEKDKTYYYQVRSIKISRGTPMESLPSPALKANLSAAHRPRPEYVEVTPRAAEIRVNWKPVTIEGQEARYNVYRSESGQSFERINANPIRASQMIDRKVNKGKAYRYAVTAFPNTKPEDESSRVASEEVKLRP